MNSWQKSHFSENLFSRIYTGQNFYLAEITFSRKLIFQNFHLPEFTFGQNSISPKTYFPEFTLASICIWPKLRTFSRKLIFPEITFSRNYISPKTYFPKFLASACSGKCNFWQVRVQENFRDNVVRPSIFRGNVISGWCFLWRCIKSCY